ncbi:MAG: putative amidohydrolase YtcJ [Chlamydiales bacterium]|jgi:predicted amidohydrolase YtcJ
MLVGMSLVSLVSRVVCALALLFGSFACLGVPDEPEVVGRSTLFTGGRIYEDAYADPVEALVTRGGWVLELGSADALRARYPDAHEVDLNGATVLPGLQDAHGHIESYGDTLGEVDLRGARSYEEVIARIAQRAQKLPEGSWITGRGWDQNLWPNKALPHHADLSARVPAHPVWVRRVDGHAGLANRTALELAGLAGILDPVPEVTGGRVLVDVDGAATGVFVDTAMRLVSAQVPVATREQRVRNILRAQEALLAKGLTCVHDMGVDREAIEIYEELRQAGKLKLRVVAYLWGNGLKSADELEGLPLWPDARDRLSVCGAKLMADGALGSRGAALLEDYADAPGERGLLRFESAAAFEQVVRLLMEAGLQPATHAIGDRANRIVLDAYETVMAEDSAHARRRPRLEHAQILAPEEWTRFRDLGVVPSMQPTHCTSDMAWVPDRLGPERPIGAYAWRRIETAPEAPLAFGSDFPVELPDPLPGIYAAVTRMGGGAAREANFYPDQRLSVREAVAAFTSGAASACFQESRRGRLSPGYGCDMTVLDRDPMGLDAMGANVLLETVVEMTVIQGEVVYRSQP